MAGAVGLSLATPRPRRHGDARGRHAPPLRRPGRRFGPDRRPLRRWR